MVSRIKSIIQNTGTFIALAIGVGVPITYATDEYFELQGHVASEGSRSAAQVAEYIYATGPLWSYTPLRLQEILADRPIEEKEESRQRVLAVDGRVLYADQNKLGGPIYSIRTPIKVGAQTVGLVETEESFRPLLAESLIVALVSAALAIMAFLLLRVLPLRVLDRTMAHLTARETELREQYALRDSALNNMSQGLCMFDGDKRLIICNRRFSEMYSLPQDLTRPGTLLTDILEHRIRSGCYDGTPESFMRGRSAMITRTERSIDVIEQNDGRAIEILFDPLPGGGWISTHEEITERRRAEARIKYLASHDPLTDLPNRTAFRERLEAALRQGNGLAVHSIDLDQFKEVNDALGHPAGDAVLLQVAERLKANARTDDFIARLGGDEFAIIQRNLDRPEAASDFANRLLHILSQPYHIDNHQLGGGASIGVTIAPTDGVDPDKLLKNADLALYRSKAEGRGTFRFFEVEMDIRLQARRTLERDFRQALQDGKLEVHYQPVLNIKENSICGFEALLRWRHPERGIVPPSEFVPLAEETGLINQLGGWVLREACSEAVKWPPSVRLAVNVSPAQFKQLGLEDAVLGALEASGLSPDRLELEITETVLLQESAANLDILYRLRSLGVRIAMDDFGTGYSSLSYLRRFPFDKIKIDQSFVHGLTLHKDSQAIVRAIISLARDLGMTTTAEGVETRKQLEILRSMACTEMQGYLISPARPGADALELLAKRRRHLSVVPTANEDEPLRA